MARLLLAAAVAAASWLPVGLAPRAPLAGPADTVVPPRGAAPHDPQLRVPEVLVASSRLPHSGSTGGFAATVAECFV